MKKIVFDSYALIALFRQEPGYEMVRDLLVKWPMMKVKVLLVRLT